MRRGAFREGSAILAKPVMLFQPDVAAFDQQEGALHQRRGEFPPRPVVDAGKRGPRNVHGLRGLLLGEVFVVQQPDRFILIQQHDYLRALSPDPAKGPKTFHRRRG